MTDLPLASIDDTPETGTMAVLMNPTALNALVTFADLMSKATITVPKHLQGKPSDCLAVVMQAAQWRMHPFAVAQQTHFINGNISYSGQLIVAVLQATGTIVGAPQYQYEGDGQDLRCRVGMVLRGETEPRWTQWLRNGDVKIRNSPLWQTHPSQQLGYRQVAYWARQYAPGAILGVYLPDELEEIPQGERYMGQVDQVQPSGPRRRSESAPAAAAPTIDAATGEISSGEPAQDPAPAAPASSSAPSSGSISGGQVAYLRNKLKAADLAEASICDRFQVASIELLSPEQFATLKGELLAAV